VTETRATRQWPEGDREIGSADREQRLRAAAHVTRLITETFDASTVQARMQGIDPIARRPFPGLGPAARHRRLSSFKWGPRTWLLTARRCER
jgi:hypothetical protein